MSQSLERQTERVTQEHSPWAPFSSCWWRNRDRILFKQALMFNSSFCVFLYHLDVDHSRQVWRGQWERCSYDTLYTGTHAWTGRHTAHRPRRQDRTGRLLSLYFTQGQNGEEEQETGFTAEKQAPDQASIPLKYLGSILILYSKMNGAVRNLISS